MKNNKKTFGWVRFGAALLIALILFAVTGFGFVPLLRGATEITDGGQLADGMYVTTDLTYIMSFCGVEKNNAGDITAYYAAAPIGNKFVLVRFDAREHDKVASLEDATAQYLQGTSASLPFYLTVTGSTVPMEEAQGELFAQWFNDNGEWMLSAGVIQSVENFGEYLCTVQLNANRVGNMTQNAVVALSCIGAAFVLYAIIELCLILSGFYNKKPQKAKKEAPKSPVTEEPAPEISAEAEEEAPAVPEEVPAPVEPEAPEEVPAPLTEEEAEAEDGNV